MHLTPRTIMILVGLLLAACAQAGDNLLINGNFDAPQGPLYGWKYNYEDTENPFYTNNHAFVRVVDAVAGKKNVLELKATGSMLSNPAGGQGVMIDSHVIPVRPGARYELTASAMSTGGDCRILCEGYNWKPGIKPHANPNLLELRKCYMFSPILFGGKRSASAGGVKASWTRASQTFPGEELSKLAKEKFDKVKFIVVHIVSIAGDNLEPDKIYYLYVKDVVLKQIK